MDNMSIRNAMTLFREEEWDGIIIRMKSGNEFKFRAEMYRENYFFNESIVIKHYIKTYDDDLNQILVEKTDIISGEDIESISQYYEGGI